MCFCPQVTPVMYMYILERARIPSGFLREKEKLYLCMSFLFKCLRVKIVFLLNRVKTSYFSGPF